MATIKEVAQRAGVSVTTVSRVLNKRGYISQEMHDKIYATMEELNYQPNEVARSLTRRRTKIIGLLVPSVDDPYFGEVVNQLILAAMRPPMWLSQSTVGNRPTLMRSKETTGRLSSSSASSSRERRLMMMPST